MLLNCIFIGAVIGFSLFGIADSVVECLGGEENEE